LAARSLGAVAFWNTAQAAVLWPDGTVVEFEHSVNAAVKRLREALGDDADKPAYIETIPRRGYRLIALLGPPRQPALRPGSWISRVLEASRWWRAVAILMLSAAALVVGYSWVRREVAGPPLTASTPVVLQRLTDFLGVEDAPAVSPDGKSVAFSAGAGTPQIWVRLLAGGRPLRITHDHVPHLYPRWFPDSASTGCKIVSYADVWSAARNCKRSWWDGCARLENAFGVSPLSHRSGGG
jgi:hypothetical protein